MIRIKYTEKSCLNLLDINKVFYATLKIDFVYCEYLSYLDFEKNKQSW